MSLTQEQLDEELKKVNENIQKLTDNLIAALTDEGIEYIDLNTYQNSLDILTSRKHKIEYMIATNIE